MKTIQREVFEMKIGRNDPCPCGSGMKYKKCCMNKKKTEDHGSSPDRISGAWEEAEMDYAMLQAENMIPFGEPRTKKDRRKAIEDILSRCPDYYPARLELGSLLLIEGDRNACLKNFDLSLEVMRSRNEKTEDIIQNIYSLGDFLERFFLYSDAIGYYKQILDLETDTREKASAHGDMANCYYLLGDNERALEEAEKGVSVDPDNCKQLSNLGWIRMIRGELGPAKEVLQKAVKIDPEDATAQGNLRACNVMRKKKIKNWESFLLNSYDSKAAYKMENMDDYEGVERERRSYNSSLLGAFRFHIAVDESRNFMEKRDLFFTLTYAMDILEKLNVDESFLFSDILTVEISMESFLAKLIVTTGDIDDDIYNDTIKVLLDFYGYLHSKGVVRYYSDLEDKIEDLREEFRVKMHTYHQARQTGNPVTKEKARDKLFGGLLWF